MCIRDRPLTFWRTALSMLAGLAVLYACLLYTSIETAKAAGTFTGDEAENVINFRASYAGRLDSADKRLVEGLNYLNSAYSYDAEKLVADNSRFTISNLDASGAIVPLLSLIHI